MHSEKFAEKEENQPVIAQVQYGDDYIQPLLLAALRSRLPSSSYTLNTSTTAPAESESRQELLQILQYEKLSFELALSHPTKVLVNAYVIRKALIRKHFLAATVAGWVAKRPLSILKNHVKPGIRLDIDYVEYLDEALADAFEVRDSIAENEQVPADQREWWILKPGMADGGNGIRLFSTEDELRAIFEEFEEDEEADEDEDEGGLHSDNADQSQEEEEEEEDDGFVITKKAAALESSDQQQQQQQQQQSNMYASQLRHFIAQLYIHPPLLFDKRKFHIRTYVLAVGALKVYVSRPMLALFAAAEYVPPWQTTQTGEDDDCSSSKLPDLRAHLTNTCLQGSTQREGSILAFWDLPDDLLHPSTLQDGDSYEHDTNWKDSVFSQICGITAEVFEAAARNEMVHFQALPNAFEVFGIDFMVDASGTTWLLEVNAFPDFKQTGDELKVLVSCLWADVVELAAKPFFFLADEHQVVEATSKRMVKVLDIDLGRR